MSSLGLGCAPIGNLYTAISDEQAIETVDAAWDAGVRFFDTAPQYGYGLSERRLGLALAGRPRDEAVVATKVGRVLQPGAELDSIFAGAPALHAEFDFSYDGTLRSFEASLERLQLDRIDVLHVHDPDDHADVALAGSFAALRRLRDEGVISKVSAGMNQSALLTRFVFEAGVDCVLIAGRYTLLDQSAEDDLLPACEAHGVSVIAAGVFNSGLLADPRPGATYDYVAAPDDLITRAQYIARICANHDVPLRAAALQFPLRHPAVTTVLTGAQTAAHITENAADFERPIPDQLWEDLVDAVS